MRACCRIARLSATPLRRPRPMFQSFPDQRPIVRAKELSTLWHSELRPFRTGGHSDWGHLELALSLYQLATKRIDLGDRSRTAAAVFPKNSTSPGRRLTPRTTRS